METQHASPISYPGPRLSRRGGSRRWGWAALGSVVAHVLLLLSLAQRTRAGAADPPPAALTNLGAVPELAAEPVLIDVAMVDSVATQVPATLAEATPSLWDAAQADRDHDVALTEAPRVAADRLPSRPSPDRGQTGGQTPRLAWGHDLTALQARLSDGAQTAQPSHRMTAAQAASPQAIRRERMVGTGDAARTRTPARQPVAAQYVPVDQGSRKEGSGTTEGTPAGVSTAVDVPRVAEGVVPESGQGPLNAEQGKRTFDNERRGLAQDDRAMRLASSERQPGLADFSHPAVPAKVDSTGGQGPGLAPGAVARRAQGTAASEYGASAVQKLGPEVSERTQDRRYDRYIQEIVGRVNRERVFPKSLALRLEQGETILFFVLRTDGQIRDGVRVVKSSGFDEFDSEAVRSVLRAAPFPPMPDPATARPLPMSMRVGFDNPVVR